MLIRIPAVLSAEQVRHAFNLLSNADWIDGRVSAGYQGLKVKDNQQIAEDSKVATELGDLVLFALERNALFISSVLPNRVYPPMFNRYAEGMTFGHHFDNGVRMLPGTGHKIRTDLSATLFLSELEDYDGGELQIEDSSGTQSVKLPAGDMVIYPATSLHRVAPLTRGLRYASFFWVQSMVRDAAQRALLFDLDRAVQRLDASNADETARLHLTGCYHNLLRMWSDI